MNENVPYINDDDHVEMYEEYIDDNVTDVERKSMEAQ